MDFFGGTSLWAFFRGDCSASVEDSDDGEAGLTIALGESVVEVVFFAAMTLDFEDAGGENILRFPGKMYPADATSAVG